MRDAPAAVTLDDVAAMNVADQLGRRYEMSPDGVLSVMPLADSEHAAVASRICAWLARAGWPAEQLLQAAGVQFPGQNGVGGRIPDLTVWAAPQPRSIWLSVTDLLLVVEIVSLGFEAMDQVVKVREYAQAGIPRYWVIDRDAAQTATLHVLSADKTYEVAVRMPLARLLETAPADHNIGG
ncbi:Uma2 family endonuclease [Actinoplanes sp. CA-051413]|uniref:Uma2 family endonuclease n=1 Tax=Actinoplanes sp. CA-051413 TaxID=3239899 RepID=UPI003D9799A2